MTSTPAATLPILIQGGMGIGVSSWKLAQEVSRKGQLGVVSGTAIDAVIARRLQDGDISGDVRRALTHFPNQEIAQLIIDRYYIEGGRDSKVPYIDVPKLSLRPTSFAVELLVVSTFVEVWLAKEGHSGLVGMNILEKIQMAIPFQLFGAILADVDYILIGAGIPAQIPFALDLLQKGKPVAMRVDVADTNEKSILKFDPSTITGISYPLKRPKFLAIVSSHALVSYLNKDDETKPDGYIIEYHVAGGHNAPPRKKDAIDGNGEAIYSELDSPNLDKIIATGSDFWLAGGFGTPEKLKEALSLGACGIQVGSLFALSNESGFTKNLKDDAINHLMDGSIHITTDATASPTGFPFKVIENEDSLSVRDNFEKRIRVCDLGYLRTPFKRESGSIGYRCPAEPQSNFVFKHGHIEQSHNAKCLCNALMADIGLGQIRPNGSTEMPLVTIGSDLEGPRRLLQMHPQGWSAAEAVTFLLN